MHRSWDWRRTIYLVVGCLFVAIAAVGVVVPLLPTTPFLLLASSCFLRSSPRLQERLARSRWFGPAIRDWNEHRAVRRSVKVLAAAAVVVALSLMFVRGPHWGVQVAAVVLGLAGLIVIWRLPVVVGAGGGGGLGARANVTNPGAVVTDADRDLRMRGADDFNGERTADGPSPAGR
jgi:uncharacterized membrane protein YbaN (DUF454 family)